MPKIALIGAGSVVFARRLTTDILSWPELAYWVAGQPSGPIVALVCLWSSEQG